MLTIILLKYTALVVLAVVLIAFLAACVFLYRLHSRYDHLPGPKRTSFFTGNASEFRSAIENQIPFVHRMLELQQEFGPVYVIFFFHQAFVSVADPATVKELLMNDVHTKPGSYDQLYELYGVRFMGKGLVTERDHSKWYNHRKIFNPAFHRKHLMGLMSYFNTSSDKLVLRLKDDVDTGKAVPLMDGISRTTLDVIAKAGFGMTQELILDESPFVEAVETSFKGMLNKFQKPYDLIFPSHWKFRREVQRAVQCLRDTGEGLIFKSRKALLMGEDLPNNILGIIMKYSNPSEDQFDMETMVDEFLTFFVAGQETTSNLVGFTMVQLGRHPEILKRVRDEIDAVVGDKDFIEYEDVMKMEYTLLVLKETLRLYSPATGISRSLAYDMTVCGHNIPAGSSVELNHYIMTRMEQFFKNPLNFDPERFVRDEDKPLYAYFPFSLGTRSCIGQQFALIEARVILAKLYQNYDFKLDPTQSFEIVDQLTLKPKGQCMNYIYSRQ
ncbi:Cholesterol 24-hydroxylase [Holothuria leucospilota]|uniref:Cholesterol 24-hydroxylase n=1 Tax=Holothuria leucospilota TaxID=206669 RepID=A0A9Q1CJP1_HOLLE|nr:Cholesterol 24-hydroxylase [Holothuria leucospilota]